MHQLKVVQGKSEEINKDIIRVHESERKTSSGKKIKTGMVCKVFVGRTNKSTHAILRGHLSEEEDKQNICIDETLREKLTVAVSKSYEFEFREASRWWGWWRWAWNASDPAYQISTRIAVVLGFFSIILGLAPFLLAYFKY